jgi:hypothetical protein
MARVVKIRPNSNIWLNVITMFEDGSTSVKTIKVGDTVENLRYIENEELQSVTGVVKEINYEILATNSNKVNPTYTLPKDIKFTTLVVDASKEYHSNIINIPIREIVEDEGVLNVTKVATVPEMNVTMSIEYTDGTIAESDISVGDILDNMIIMSDPGRPDITGRFSVRTFIYTVNNKVLNVTGMNLYNNERNVMTEWNKIIRFEEIPSVRVAGVGLSDVATLLESDDAEVGVVLSGDVVVPDREDDRITTLIVPEGKTLNVDLGGHTLDVAAYAFYSTGGTIIINDTTGNGVIKTRSHKTYGAVYTKNGKVIMNGGVIDVRTDTDDIDHNYMYGIVAAGSGVVEMNGGVIHTAEACGAAITNGTAEGEGAVFEFGGNAKLLADLNYAIYLADNKKVLIKDNAVVEGICARMGDIEVRDNAKVINNFKENELEDFGSFLTSYNGVSPCRDGILVMAGMYQSVGTGNNDVNITVSGNATISSDIGSAIGIAKVESKFDQIVNVDVAKASNLKPAPRFDNIHVYEFEECEAIATESGKSITKTSEVTCTINVAGKQVYPA